MTTRDELLDGWPLMLTVPEVSQLLRTGRTATYDAIRRGDIYAIKVGRNLRVPKHRLVELLDGDGS